MVLKKELRVLYLDPNAARRGRHGCLDFGSFKAYPFLQTCPKKDMPTPTRPQLFFFPFGVVHSQMTKHSNIWAYEGNSYSHHTTIYSQLQATVSPHIFTVSLLLTSSSHIVTIFSIKTLSSLSLFSRLFLFSIFQ